MYIITKENVTETVEIKRYNKIISYYIMLSKSKPYPYKIDDLHKSRTVEKKAGRYEYCIPRPKKVSFNTKVYIYFINNRDEYDKHMIRQLWWSRHELADLREQNEVQPKLTSHFLDFLFTLCDWN